MIINLNCKDPNTLNQTVEELKNELDLSICSLLHHENQNYEPLVTSDAIQQNIRVAMINRNGFQAELTNETDFLHAYCLNRNIHVSATYSLSLTIDDAYKLLAALKLEGY